MGTVTCIYVHSMPLRMPAPKDNTSLAREVPKTDNSAELHSLRVLTVLGDMHAYVHPSRRSGHEERPPGTARARQDSPKERRAHTLQLNSF